MFVVYLNGFRKKQAIHSAYVKFIEQCDWAVSGYVQTVLIGFEFVIISFAPFVVLIL